MDNSSSKIDVPHGTMSKVIRFGSDLFSPLIPPLTPSSTTAAVNPQDIFLRREVSPQLHSPRFEKVDSIYQPSLTMVSSRARVNEIPFGNAIAIGPAGYIETVRSPYSSFGDIFFDVNTPDPSFSIESTSDNPESNKNILYLENLGEFFTTNSNTVAMRSPLNEESNIECVLPPSSAILQSQLDNSSLDYFISNNSFIEEIKSSLSVEQQQYINSGMTKPPSTNLCTTVSPSITTRSDDLVLPNYSENVNALQPDVTDEMFEHSNSDDESDDNCFSILVSPATKHFSLEEDDTVSLSSNEDLVDESKITRLQELLYELRSFNDEERKENCSSIRLENIKNKYITEINDAFVNNNALPTIDTNGNKIENLYFAIIKSYKKANSSIEYEPLNRNTYQKIGYSEVHDIKVHVKQERTLNKKRKLVEAVNDAVVNKKRYKKKTWEKEIKLIKKNDKHEDVKKSRKNYNADTINILMDWYLENDGKPPNTETKQHLSHLTNKTDIQISTWFQNARRRYERKLKDFQYLNSKFPSLVYDNQSLKKYLKANK